MTAPLPGVTVEIVPPPAEQEPLRTDVAGFLGATVKGPVGVPVRTDGLTDFVRRFGGFDQGSDTAYAVRGYFENEGGTAWILRVSGPATTAEASWIPALPVLPTPAYRVQATSPGGWANGLTVHIGFRPAGLDGQPEFAVRASTPDGVVEYLTVPPAALAGGLAASTLIRLAPGASAPPVPSRPLRRPGPWDLVLDGGADAPPDLDDYLAAMRTLAEVPEVAIVAAPDLHRHLAGDDRDDAVDALIDLMGQELDRLLILDVPAEEAAADRAAAWVGTVQARQGGGARDVAVYHPPLLVPDPLGTVSDPLRPVPAAGHVAGVVSRLDRQRGPHHTPANAVLDDAVDLAVAFGEAEETLLYRSAVNLLRCIPGRGLQVWGGRTLTGTGFVAHRRLLHQLVRAVRAVATPLVFDVNGPELRLTLVRGVTSVLLQAFRAGALQGARPPEAFQVRCDETNNPPGQDPGLVVCEIAVAAAVPMEFIRLRLLLGAEGRLEVIEA
jgi:hypothetical protein